VCVWGSLQSRPRESIRKEIEELAAAGYKEVLPAVAVGGRLSRSAARGDDGRAVRGDGDARLEQRAATAPIQASGITKPFSMLLSRQAPQRKCTHVPP
jgi:hypothetical protein